MLQKAEELAAQNGVFHCIGPFSASTMYACQCKSIAEFILQTELLGSGSGCAPIMAFWTDNISNISDEELCKDDLHLDSILAKEITLSEDVEDQEDRGSVISEVVDLSWPSKKASWINDKRANIEESRAVDLSLRSKAPCSISEEEELTLEESSVCPDKSQKEEKLLDILRLASRPTGDQGMLCHLCDLEVVFIFYSWIIVSCSPQLFSLKPC